MHCCGTFLFFFSHFSLSFAVSSCSIMLYVIYRGARSLESSKPSFKVPNSASQQISIVVQANTDTATPPTPALESKPQKKAKKTFFGFAEDVQAKNTTRSTILPEVSSDLAGQLELATTQKSVARLLGGPGADKARHRLGQISNTNSNTNSGSRIMSKNFSKITRYGAYAFLTKFGKVWKSLSPDFHSLRRRSLKIYGLKVLFAGM